MNKNSQLNKLFKEWRNNVPEYKKQFISDGIINEALYDNAECKILFIEKEANDNSGEDWDFRVEWQNKPKDRFTYRIAEWSYGLFNGFPEYDSIWNKGSAINDVIKQIAFMNVKKSGGPSRSDLDDMVTHANINRQFIEREIQIINPDIIIMGMSWKKLRNAVLPGLDWKMSGYDIEISKWQQIKVLDFYHPSALNGPAASYSLLQNIANSKAFKKL